MARRVSKPKTRLDMRREVEAAERMEQPGAAGQAAAGAAPETGRKKAVAKKPAAKKSPKKKAEPARMRLVWGVFDNANQEVAKYPHNERSAADLRAKELSEKNGKAYFVQPIKEAIPAAILAEKNAKAAEAATATE